MVEPYCMDVFHHSNEDLAKKLNGSEYDLIGLPFMAARFKETVSPLCDIINEHKKNAWLVLGGAGASSLPEYILEKTCADVVSIGESENTMCEIVESKLGKGDCSQIRGIAYREEDKITLNPRRGLIKRLDDIPFPAWHLFPMDKYTSSFKAPGMKDEEKMLSIVTSRGCINHCNFCYRMDEGFRARSLENVIGEIKMAKEDYGIDYFFIVDELFVLNEKRVIEFERLLKENDLKIKYTAEARVDIFNEKIVNSLKRSGCQYVNIGFESSSQKVLDEIGKNTTIAQNLKAMQLCKEVDLPVGLNFIWGFENDNYETLLGNVEMIMKYNQYHQLRTIRPVTPYPGTKLYFDAIRKGLLSGPEDFFKRFKNSDLITVNFTKFPFESCYEWLLEANTQLIKDHYNHFPEEVDDADRLINQFSDLYSGKKTTFRGARNYAKKDE